MKQTKENKKKIPYCHTEMGRKCINFLYIQNNYTWKYASPHEYTTHKHKSYFMQIFNVAAALTVFECLFEDFLPLLIQFRVIVKESFMVRKILRNWTENCCQVLHLDFQNVLIEIFKFLKLIQKFISSPFNKVKRKIRTETGNHASQSFVNTFPLLSFILSIRFVMVQWLFGIITLCMNMSQN